MFNFQHVLNATTKTRYFISNATLDDGGEGYNESPDEGNSFKIDLQPENPDGAPISGVDLYVSNDGRNVLISKNLDSKTGWQEGNTFHEEMQDAMIEGKTLVVTTEKQA